MKPLLAIATNNTEANNRFQYTKECIESLINNSIHFKTEMHIIINGDCKKTIDYLNKLPTEINIIINSENIGTARAINQAWSYRKEGQHAIKMDDDTIILSIDWVEQMSEAIERESSIGIIGLKRNDLWEYPGHPNPDYDSELIMLPHEVGQRWIVVEKVKHVIGTCQMYNSALLDKIGYMYQPGLYGYDDVISSWRSQIAGYINVFLPHIEIIHNDGLEPGYQDWKHKHSGANTDQVIKEVNEMLQGTRPIRVEYY